MAVKFGSNSTLTTAYGYDEINRLTSATYPGQSATSFTYDWVGNRLTAGSSTYTYDKADRLTSPGSFTYWGTGSLWEILGSPDIEFTYDARELLSTVGN